jgi:UDP-N-acetylglucosamine--N-acetylmuramyl-(pentapeptide) pyrophosphoryl-undecaprenol N-acetylglucosamine transferase
MRVIISGGGTGGHIFPALAIANALKEIDSTTDILFVGAEGRMEMEKIPAAGYAIEGLKISGLQRSFTLKNLSFPFKVISSLTKAGKIIDRFKPDVAVGVGGYASGPLLYMASCRGIPSVIQEQNSYPGITNKILARRAQRICVAYEGMDKFFPKDKLVITGNPVRMDILNTEGKRQEAFQFFGLDENKKTILVVGGSQGARSINRSIHAGIQKISGAGVQLIWQTGKAFLPEAISAVKSADERKLKAYDFISRMDLAYAAADLVVSRAGASTVSELCITGKPAIMVPLPTAAEDHQTKNIRSLVNRNAAYMITDAEAGSKLVDKAISLVKDEAALNELKNNIKQLALPGSAVVIANQIRALAGS